MRLSTTQGAEKLGVTEHTVRQYRDQGKLTDVAIRKDGAKKHYSYFDSKQINEFAKTFNPRRRVIPHSTGNGLPVIKPSAGILSRLEAIENKLDRLLAVWE